MYIQVIRRNDSLGGQSAQAEDPAEQWTEEQLLASDTIRKQDFVVVHTRRKEQAPHRYMECCRYHCPVIWIVGEKSSARRKSGSPAAQKDMPCVKLFCRSTMQETPRRDPPFQYIVLDCGKRTVCRGTEQISLSHCSFTVLLYLLREPNTVHTRKQMLLDIWGEDVVKNERVGTYISKLRRTFQRWEEFYIATICGVGYAAISPFLYPPNN